jgi:hypothetical protein
MKMKKIIALVAAGLMSMSANATLIEGIEFGEGLVLQTGSVFFNTETPPIEGVSLVEGIGQINAIYQGSDIIWQTGDNGKEYNFVFYDLLLDTISTPDIFGSVSYGDVDGYVNFYSNDVGTFSATGDYATDSANIAINDALIEAMGHNVVVGQNAWSVVGQADDDSNAGTGQLQVLGGLAYDLIVQDQLIRTDGSFVDMTFNYSTDILLTNGYDWSGSVDMATVTRVPEPTGLALMGLGLLGLVGARKFVA